MDFLPQDVPYGPSEDLFRGTVVPLLQRPVDEEVPLLIVQIGDAGGEVVGDQANAVTALAQRLLGSLALGDVMDQHETTLHLSILVEVWHVGHFDGACHSVGICPV